jgi:hypothetical protein
MTIFRTLMLRAAMALALACCGAPALAGQIHYVSIDTSTLAGQNGYLDFLFLGLDAAAAAEARVSMLSGRFTGSGTDFTLGDAAGAAGSGLVLGNGGSWNEAGLGARFGGLFRFAVEFDLAASPDVGTTLSVALLDATLNYLGPQGDVARFALQPGQDVDVYLDPAFATVGPNPVPEPASAWLMVAGLLLVAGRVTCMSGACPPKSSSHPSCRPISPAW